MNDLIQMSHLLKILKIDPKDEKSVKLVERSLMMILPLFIYMKEGDQFKTDTVTITKLSSDLLHLDHEFSLDEFSDFARKVVINIPI